MRACQWHISGVTSVCRTLLSLTIFFCWLLLGRSSPLAQLFSLCSPKRFNFAILPDNAVLFRRAVGAFVDEVLSGLLVTIQTGLIPLAVSSLAQHSVPKQGAIDRPLNCCGEIFRWHYECHYCFLCGLGPRAYLSLANLTPLAGREYGRKEFDIPVKAILYFLFCPPSQDRHILSDYFWYAYLIQILPAVTPAILSFDAA